MYMRTFNSGQQTRLTRRQMESLGTFLMLAGNEAVLQHHLPGVAAMEDEFIQLYGEVSNHTVMGGRLPEWLEA